MNHSKGTKAVFQRIAVPGFVRDSFVVVLGTALGQFAVFAGTPLLARIYSPTTYGDFAAFAAVTAVIQPISCLRFDLAIPKASDDKVGATFVAAIASSIVVTLVVALIAASLNEAGCSIGPTQFCTNGPLIAVAAFVIGVFQACTYLAIRYAAFLSAAFLKGGQGFAFISAALVHSIGLIPAHICGYAVGLVYVVRKRSLFRTANAQAIRQSISANREFALLNAPMALLDALSLNIPLLIIGSAFGAASLGGISIFQKFFGGPLVLIGAAVGQVFLNRAGAYVRDGISPQRLLLKVVFTLAIGWALWLILIGLLSHLVTARLLGADWRTDTGFVLLALFPMAVRMIVSPITTTFLMVGRIRVGAAWQAAHFSASVSLLIYFSTRLTLESFLVLYGIIESIAYAVCLGLAWYVTRTKVD